MTKRSLGPPAPRRFSFQGPELRLGYYLTGNWALLADGVLFNTVGTSANDGWGGRGLADGVVAGAELGLNYDVSRNLFLYARAAYDNNFRNDFGQGIVNGGLGAGYRW